jgi:hypothetical protein
MEGSCLVDPRHLRRAAGLIAVVVGSMLLAVPAFAQTGDASDDRDTQVVINGRLDVPQGQTDGSAVLFNGTADIAGSLTGALVVFNGDVTISGDVRKDVVVFNGSLTVASGATIGGDVVSRQTPQIADGATVQGEVRSISGAYDLGEFGLLGRFAWWLGYSISALILGLVMLALFPRMDAAILDGALNRIGASLGFGAAFFFALPIAAIVLIAVVVGIPLGLFLLLGLALIYTVGFVVGAHALGRIILKLPRSRYVAFLLGWGILRVVGLVPVLGGLVWLVAAIFGLGVIFTASRARRDVDPMTVRPETGQPVIPAAPR